MTDQERLLLDSHDKRILKLEQNTLRLEEKFDEVNENIAKGQIKTEEKSMFMIAQNESLIKQNERFSQQLGDVFNSVMLTREKESERRHEIKRLTNDSRLKIFTLILGSGSVGYVVIETIMRFINQ